MSNDSPIRISWPTSVAGAQYRVVIKEDSEETGKTIYVGCETQCELPERPQAGKHYTVRIEHNQGADGTFTTLLNSVCLSEWYPYQEPSIVLEIPCVKNALYYRFVVEDIRNGLKVIDRRTISSRLQVPLSRLYNTAKYSWRAQANIDGVWGSWSSAARLHLMPASAHAINTQHVTNTPELLFILSIDTEGQVKMQRDPNPQNVVDEQIFCKTPAGELGIHYQMDALEQRGGKGTFFIDILMAYEFGEVPTRQYIDAIMERGHDVQLHLHPSPHLRGANNQTLRDIDKRWKRDYSVDAFKDALDLAYNLFYKYTGQKPVAFRNGAYRLQDAYFPVLAEYGLMVDSTLYPYKNCALDNDFNTATLPFLHPSGVLELPVGWLGIENRDSQRKFTQFTVRFDGYGNYLKQMISNAHHIFAGHSIVPLTFIIHSYTFLQESTITDAEEIEKWNTRMKKQLSPFFHSSLTQTSKITFFEGTHHARLRSFNDLLDAVAANPAIKIVTFKDIYETYFERLKSQIPTSYTLPIFYPATDEFKTSAFQSYSPAYLKQLCEYVSCPTYP